MIPKEFSVHVLVTDEEIRATGADEALLRIVWLRFPSIRREFVDDFEAFVAFSQSIVEGRSSVVGGKTSSSRQSDRVSLAQQ